MHDNRFKFYLKKVHPKKLIQNLYWQYLLRKFTSFISVWVPALVRVSQKEIKANKNLTKKNVSPKYEGQEMICVEEKKGNPWTKEDPIVLCNSRTGEKIEKLIFSKIFSIPHSYRSGVENILEQINQEATVPGQAP